MARLDPFLRYQPEGRGLMRRKAREKRELQRLFGRRTVSNASHIEFTDLPLTSDRVDAVMTASFEVDTKTGDVEAQRAVVNRLDDVTKTMLCLWMDHPSNAGAMLDLAFFND